MVVCRTRVLAFTARNTHSMFAVRQQSKICADLQHVSGLTYRVSLHVFDSTPPNDLYASVKNHSEARGIFPRAPGTTWRLDHMVP